MHPFEAKQIIYQTQIVVSVVDPLGIGGSANEGVVVHEYDDLGVRAAGVLVRGGSALRAVAAVQRTLRSEWGTAMNLPSSWRLRRDVIGPYVKPALRDPMP